MKKHENKKMKNNQQNAGVLLKLHVPVLIMQTCIYLVILTVGPEGCQIQLEDGDIITVNVNISMESL